LSTNDPWVKRNQLEYINPERSFTIVKPAFKIEDIIPALYNIDLLKIKPYRRQYLVALKVIMMKTKCSVEQVYHVILQTFVNAEYISFIARNRDASGEGAERKSQRYDY
jgi:hypothetical protein